MSHPNGLAALTPGIQAGVSIAIAKDRGAEHNVTIHIFFANATEA